MIKKIILLTMFLFPLVTIAQEGTNTAGGDAVGFGGSVSFTVGQLDYLVSEDTLNGGDSLRVAGDAPCYTSQGIQHAENKNQITEGQSLVVVTTSPNPATEYLDVSIINAKGTFNYEIIDAAGKTVLTGYTDNIQFRINTATLADGQYILSVLQSGAEIQKQPIIISK